MTRKDRTDLIVWTIFLLMAAAIYGFLFVSTHP